MNVLRRAKPKLLLIRVPDINSDFHIKDLRTSSTAIHSIPLAIAYLVSTIRDQNIYEVDALDLSGKYYHEINIFVNTRDYDGLITFLSKAICDRIDEFKPDIVGFSAVFLFQHRLTKDLITITKRHYGHLKILLGGYPTILPDRIIQDIPQVDVVFIGEAEKSLQEVLLAQSNNHPLENIQAIAYRSNGGYAVNHGLNVVKDLNRIPFPSFDLLPMDMYKQVLGKTEIPFLSSRGCPFSCNYCASSMYTAGTYRMRSLSNIVDELELIHSSYGIDTLLIRDDNFNVNNKHSKGILKSFINRSFSFDWYDTSSFHANSVDNEFLDLCKQSGCQMAIIAVESGSPRVLKEIMNKSVDLDHVRKLAQHCHDIDLPLRCYFVIGNPGETLEEIQQTIAFAADICVDDCVISIATPFPGTKYYDFALRHGLVDSDLSSILEMKYMSVTMKNEEFSQEELKTIQYDANIRLNFLQNKALRSDGHYLQWAKAKFQRIARQYPFHAVAWVVFGYLQLRIGNAADAHESFRKVEQLLKDEQVASSYSKYFDWDSPAIAAYRQFLDASVTQGQTIPS